MVCRGAGRGIAVIAVFWLGRLICLRRESTQSAPEIKTILSIVFLSSATRSKPQQLFRIRLQIITTLHGYFFAAKRARLRIYRTAPVSVTTPMTAKAAIRQSCAKVVKSKKNILTAVAANRKNPHRRSSFFRFFKPVSNRTRPRMLQ